MTLRSSSLTAWYERWSSVSSVSLGSVVKKWPWSPWASTHVPASIRPIFSSWWASVKTWRPSAAVCTYGAESVATVPSDSIVAASKTSTWSA